MKLKFKKILLFFKKIKDDIIRYIHKSKLPKDNNRKSNNLIHHNVVSKEYETKNLNYKSNVEEKQSNLIVQNINIEKKSNENNNQFIYEEKSNIENKCLNDMGFQNLNEQNNIESQINIITTPQNLDEPFDENLELNEDESIQNFNELREGKIVINKYFKSLSKRKIEAKIRNTGNLKPYRRHDPTQFPRINKRQKNGKKTNQPQTTYLASYPSYQPQNLYKIIKHSSNQRRNKVSNFKIRLSTNYEKIELTIPSQLIDSEKLDNPQIPLKEIIYRFKLNSKENDIKLEVEKRNNSYFIKGKSIPIEEPIKDLLFEYPDIFKKTNQKYEYKHRDSNIYIFDDNNNFIYFFEQSGKNIDVPINSMWLLINNTIAEQDYEKILSQYNLNNIKIDIKEERKIWNHKLIHIKLTNEQNFDFKLRPDIQSGTIEVEDDYKKVKPLFIGNRLILESKYNGSHSLKVIIQHKYKNEAITITNNWNGKNQVFIDSKKDINFPGTYELDICYKNERIPRYSTSFRWIPDFNLSLNFFYKNKDSIILPNEQEYDKFIIWLNFNFDNWIVLPKECKNMGISRKNPWDDCTCENEDEEKVSCKLKDLNGRCPCYDCRIKYFCPYKFIGECVKETLNIENNSFPLVFPKNKDSLLLWLYRLDNLKYIEEETEINLKITIPRLRLKLKGEYQSWDIPTDLDVTNLSISKPLKLIINTNDLFSEYDGRLVFYQEKNDKLINEIEFRIGYNDNGTTEKDLTPLIDDLKYYSPGYIKLIINKKERQTGKNIYSKELKIINTIKKI